MTASRMHGRSLWQYVRESGCGNESYNRAAPCDIWHRILSSILPHKRCHYVCVADIPIFFSHFWQGKKKRRKPNKDMYVGDVCLEMTKLICILYAHQLLIRKAPPARPDPGSSWISLLLIKKCPSLLAGHLPGFIAQLNPI